MELGSVSVATVSWARSAVEEQTLRRSLACLSGLGLRIAVADRGNRPEFTTYLQARCAAHVTVPAEQSLVAQVRASCQVAGTFDTPFILYTEADKQAFFAERLAGFLAGAPEDDDVGVVLAARSPAAFGTFPAMQRYAEGVVNRLCAEVIGVAGDYCYGPFVMNRALLPLVHDLRADLGWGWRTAVFVAARHRGLRVVHLAGAHTCPPDQQTEDRSDRTHRMRQLSQNIRGLVDGPE